MKRFVVILILVLLVVAAAVLLRSRPAPADKPSVAVSNTVPVNPPPETLTEGRKAISEAVVAATNGPRHEVRLQRVLSPGTNPPPMTPK